MKDDGFSGAKSNVGNLNNLEVCKFIEGKHFINGSIASAKVGKMVM